MKQTLPDKLKPTSGHWQPQIKYMKTFFREKETHPDRKSETKEKRNKW